MPVETLNPQQQAVYDSLMAGEWTAYQALPGTGKTTVARHVIRDHDGKRLYTAFSNRAVREVEKEIIQYGAQASTLNALGHKILIREIKGGRRQHNVNQWKYRNLAWAGLEQYDITFPSQIARKFAAESLDLMCMLARAHLLTYRDETILQRIAGVYGVLWQDWMARVVAWMIDRGVEMALQGDWDFDDQLYIPYVQGYPPTDTFDLVMIDEAQDTTPAKLWLALAHADVEATVGITGDPNQSIMGFSGAMTDSWERALEITGEEATSRGKTLHEKAIDITYRFGKGIAEYVNEETGIAIAIAPETVDLGSRVKRRSRLTLELLNKDNSAVLARQNATLVSLGLQLSALNVPVKLEARGLNKSMERHLKEVIRHNRHIRNLEELIRAIRAYEGAKREEFKLAGADARTIGELVESCQCLVVAAKIVQSTDVDVLMAEVNKMFNSKFGTTLLTMHTSKGREWDATFVLGVAEIGCSHRDMGAMPWEQQQSQNLKVVALTRAKRELWLISEAVLETPEQPDQPQQLELMPQEPSPNGTPDKLAQVKELLSLGFSHAEIAQILGEKE